MTTPALPVLAAQVAGHGRRLLSVPAFRSLWIASWLSATGHQIVRVGLILHLAGSREGVWAIALYVALDTLPGTLAAPLAGPLIDRWPKPAVMIGANLARVGLAAAVLASPTTAVIYAATALHSVASAFFQPAKSAAIPLAVEERRIAAANGVDQSAGNLVFVVAPILAAELYFGLGLAGVLTVHIAFHLASAAALRGLRLGGRGDQRPEGDAATTAADGDVTAPSWRPLFADSRLRLLLGLSFVSMFCTGLWLPLAPSFLAGVLGGGSRSLGWQIGLTGLGAVLGALWAARCTARFGKGRVLLAAFVAEGSTLTVYSLVPSLAGSMLLMVLWGVTVSMITVPFHSLLQTGLRHELLGRTFTLVQQSESLALLLATVAAILVDGRVAPQTAFLAVGLLYTSTALAAARSRRGRAIGAES